MCVELVFLDVMNEMVVAVAVVAKILVVVTFPEETTDKDTVDVKRPRN